MTKITKHIAKDKNIRTVDPLYNITKMEGNNNYCIYLGRRNDLIGCEKEQKFLRE